jgi:hypothetical protein
MLGAARLQRLAGAALLSSCTVLSEFDVQVCEVDADCAVAGEGPQVCEEARCEPGCRDNHQCVELDPRTPLCSERGGECRSLTSADGACYLGSTYDDAALGASTLKDLSIIGAFTPEVESPVWLTLELGAREINASGGALGSDGASHPLLLAVCDDAAASVVGASSHLLDRLGVRAVLASLGEDALGVLASQPAARGQALWLSPYSAGPALASSSEPWAWYMQGRYSDAVDAYAALARRAGAAVSASLAVVVSESPEDIALANAVVAEVSPNRLLERFDRLRSFSLRDADASGRAALVAELIEYSPDLVLVFAGGGYPARPRVGRAEELALLFAQAENQAPSAPPAYVWGPRNSSDPGLIRALSAHPELAARSVGVDLRGGGDPELGAGLAARALAAFPDAVQPIDPRVYDALYFLTYALAAPAPTASAGFERITSADGERVAVGPGADAIERARLVLEGAGTLRAAGVTGPAAFDGATRVRAALPRLYCWGPNAARDGVATLAELSDGELSPLAAECETEIFGDP